MKKIAVLLLAVLLFTGCGAKKEPTVHRVVTGVQVEFDRGGETITRTYTKNTSVESVLTYLRILRPFGPTIPKGEFDSTCRITLHYSQGPDSVYVQQGNAYLRKDGGDWQNIDNSRGSLIYPLLLLLPSDA